MEQTNIIKFLNEAVNYVIEGEEKLGFKALQDGLNDQLGRAIAMTSFVALGYFTINTSDPILFGIGLATGAIFSYGEISSTLTEGALLPMDQKGYFAFQKVCLLAILLQKNYGFPIGFLAGNALVHHISSDL